jgi:hypothetical protein
MARAMRMFDELPYVDDYSDGWVPLDVLYGPLVPSPKEYVIPRREILDEDELIVARIRENQICTLFRQEGFKFREKMYVEQGKSAALSYLRWWFGENQHIPKPFLLSGTRDYESPADPLCAAIIQDVDMGDGMYGGVDYRFKIYVPFD